MKTALFSLILCIQFFLNSQPASSIPVNSMEKQYPERYSIDGISADTRKIGYGKETLIQSPEYYTGSNSSVVVPRHPSGLQFYKQAPVAIRIFSGKTCIIGIKHSCGTGFSNVYSCSTPPPFPLRV